MFQRSAIDVLSKISAVIADHGKADVLAGGILYVGHFSYEGIGLGFRVRLGFDG